MRAYLPLGPRYTHVKYYNIATPFPSTRGCSLRTVFIYKSKVIDIRACSCTSSVVDVVEVKELIGSTWLSRSLLPGSLVSWYDHVLLRGSIYDTYFGIRYDRYTTLTGPERLFIHSITKCGDANCVHIMCHGGFKQHQRRTRFSSIFNEPFPLRTSH